MQIPLGPFELRAPVAQGGMGEVWRGLHIAQQLPVAVKVVTAENARDPEYQRGFRDEVRAMARLDHPGIVTVLDHGEISKATEAEVASLATGSPFLVMEWLGAGSLARIGAVESWSQLKMIITELLDALAHAHARGVIHRDIKPGNVLLGRRANGRLQLKLTDFGIAHALDSAQTLGDHTTSGTPKYMAPEQIRGSWRDQGPWTDLYAVGCLAYRMATGRPPFWKGETAELLRSHLMAPLPELETSFPQPPGLSDWINWMLAKDPSRRFQRAADAAWALAELDDDALTDDSIPHLQWDDVERASTTSTLKIQNVEAEDGPSLGVTLPVDTWAAEQSTTASLDLAGVTGALPEEAQRHRPTPPPLPTSWRRPEAESKPMELIGAGLGLYGLRPIPLVDRETERDLVWERLCEVSRERATGVVHLVGESGNGKSRLAEWIAQRADEVGGAQVIRATHSPMQGPADGLGRAAAVHLRTVGLSFEECEQRVRAYLAQYGDIEEYDCLSLCALMQPEGPPAERFRFTGPTERYLVFHRFLERACLDRPVLLWLDDVQWASDALTFVRFLLKRQTRVPLPVLVLLTEIEDEAESPGVARQLELIRAHETASTIRVEPLTDADHQDLVRHLLRLDDELANQVRGRTAGNPLFAVQLVGDWVQRGVLEVGPDGFRLRQGETAPIPNDIHELWSSHIQRIVTRFSDPTEQSQAREALEIAAALGVEIDATEWKQSCAEADIQIPDGLVTALLESRLALGRETGWAFAHGMLRESLERSSRESERAAAHHLACARMLAPRCTRSGPTSERYALHLLAAGELEMALEPLLDAAEYFTTVSEFAPAHELYALRENALQELEILRDDPRWSLGWARQAKSFAKQGRLDECQELVERTEHAAEDAGWTERLADAAWLRGHLHNKRGNIDEGIEEFERATRLYESIGNEQGVSNCLYGLGELRKLRGDYEGAVQAYEKAVQRCEGLGLEDTKGIALAGLSDTWRRIGDLDKALELSTRAIDVLRAVGNRNNLAISLNDRGDVCRYIGNSTEAEALYREAERMLASHGSRDLAIVQMNLAMLLMERDAFDEASEILEMSAEQLRELDRAAYLIFNAAIQLPCRAGSSEWTSFDELMERIQQDLSGSNLFDEDIARPLERAGGLCRKRGEAARARRALELALAQWQGLSKPEDAERVQVALNRLQ